MDVISVAEASGSSQDKLRVRPNAITRQGFGLGVSFAG